MNTPADSANIGVIGAGWWATHAHLPAIGEHPRARLRSVHSRTSDKAEKVARDFGAPHGTDSVEAMLDLPDLDAVIIASTPNAHHGQARMALEAGKHVLLEKPMTFTAAEAEELCRIAEERGLHLLISCPWHYTAHGRAAREWIRGGRLGDIRMLSLLMTNPVESLIKGLDTRPPPGSKAFYTEPNKGSYDDPAVAGGGQIYCQVSHAAAYIPYLTGLDPADVYARFDPAGSANDIYDALVVTLENGALVSLASTAATPVAERNYEVRVYGTRGILLMELWKGRCEFVSFEGERETLPDLAPDDIYPVRAPARNLIETVLGNETNASPGALGLVSMRIIEAACRSARDGRAVTVDGPATG